MPTTAEGVHFLHGWPVVAIACTCTLPYLWRRASPRISLTSPVCHMLDHFVQVYSRLQSGAGSVSPAKPRADAAAGKHATRQNVNQPGSFAQVVATGSHTHAMQSISSPRTRGSHSGSSTSQSASPSTQNPAAQELFQLHAWLDECTLAVRLSQHIMHCSRLCADLAAPCLRTFASSWVSLWSQLTMLCSINSVNFHRSWI
jgi:hypothetical protein